MLNFNFTENLVRLQGVLIKNIENNENIIISIEMKHKLHNCPYCNEKINTIHDYRLQRILFSA